MNKINVFNLIEIYNTVEIYVLMLQHFMNKPKFSTELLNFRSF